MTDLQTAIARYHDWLAEGDLAAESQGMLDALQQQRGLTFGTRPVCTVLRPRFLTTEQYRQLQAAMHALLPAFRKAYVRALHDAAFRAQFRLADWEEALIRDPEPYRASSPTARMDTFFANGVPRCTEYNAETPAGGAYHDALAEIMLALPVMRRFEQHYEVHPLIPHKHHVLNALLQSYDEWGGRSRPRIAILDWEDVPTRAEFVEFQRYAQALGFECVIADPRACDYHNGRLFVAGAPVNLVYKRVLISELITREGMNSPLVRAVRERAVCMVNSFHCKILHRKTSLAVLSDETNADMFTPEEQRAIQRYIPWTRVVTERRTHYEGQSVDLLPFIAQHKDAFVLKPADEYGGKGVVLGWTVSQAEWEQALREALAQPTVVQARVTVPAEPYPSFADGALHILDRWLDTNPYIWQDAYASGCLTRLSTAALLNVTAGGGSTVPTFVIEARA
ncbi:MAG: circularly permuted type 2 ATP-grasp protein [Thermoflexales bacterium]|nr:circularly permuted type 2 ATP-grasp protein [Thermoflexales bacterium]MDW8292462.1 circularly permuted type 2 ATP-grasp protein [Anaerolineae bacterium]